MDCTEDGLSLVVHSNRGLTTWNIDLQVEAVPSPRWSLVDEEIVCFAISPASDQAVFGRTSKSSKQQTDLFEVNLRNGESRPLFDKFGWRLVRLAISPNNKFMLGVEDSGDVVLLERPLGQGPWQHCTIPGLCTGTSSVVCFSPDSKLLITSDLANRRLVAWDLNRKAMRSQFETQPTMVTGCEFLNDDQFFSWGFDTLLRVWNLNNYTLERQIVLSL